MVEINKNVKKALRTFTPGVKFRSLFGAECIVHSDDEFRFEGREITVKDTKGQFRMVFDGKYFAEIIE